MVKNMIYYQESMREEREREREYTNAKEHKTIEDEMS